MKPKKKQTILDALKVARTQVDLVLQAIFEEEDRESNWTQILAHNLNNQLVTLFFLIEFLATDVQEGREQDVQSYVNYFRMTAERLQDAVQRLMKLSRDRTALLQTETIDLRALAAEIVDLSAEYARRKEIAIELIHLDEDLSVIADKNAVKEVLYNLVGNALKFCPKGARVEVRFFAEPDSVGCSVIDNGPGLTQEDHSLLFQMGASLSAKPTWGEPSTGFGLAIIKNLVTEMGGDIWATSTPGQGATFSFRLPRRPKTPNPPT